MENVKRVVVNGALAEKAKPFLERRGYTLTSYIKVQLMDLIEGVETPIKKKEESDKSLSDLL